MTGISPQPPSGKDGDSQRWWLALGISLILHALFLATMPGKLSPKIEDKLVSMLAVELRQLVPAPGAQANEVLGPPTSLRKPAAARPAAEASAARPIRQDTLLVMESASTADQVVPAVATPENRPKPESAMTLSPQRNLTPDSAALAGYHRTLSQAVERFKYYPRIAQLRQWQGTTVLSLNIDADGHLLDYRLARSSGFEVLDQQALEMLRAALPLPQVPVQLAGLALSVDIPVVFRIVD